MGLAASQARLLLLTARKSDLEYRAQCITNTEMILAMQTEEVARKYSNAISNTALFYVKADNEAAKNQALSTGIFAGIVSGAFRLEKLVGPKEDGTLDYKPYQGLTDLYKPISYTWTPSQDYEWHWVDNDGDGENENCSGCDDKHHYKKGTPVTLSPAEYETLSDAEKENCKPNYPEYSDAFDALELMELINNGQMRIVNDADGTPVSLSGNTGFTETYYTDDDAQAEAEYKRATAAIQIKEKRLQNDLHQVETQQKACEQEIDSVKKVMDKNIEKTFKVFS